MTSLDAQQKFNKFSREIAEEFLQTVLVVDDKAETSILGSEDSPKVLELISSTQRGNRTPSQTGASSTIGLPLQAANQDIVKASLKEDTELLAIKGLNQSFAEKGIVCGFLRPKATGQDRIKIIKAAEKTAIRADIVILDWKMEEGDSNAKHTEGYTAKRIIKAILSHDKEGDDTFQIKGRLRLIAIYSQSKDLSKIIDSILKSLKSIKPEMLFTKQDEFTLTRDSTRICAFKKSGGVRLKKTDPLYERTLNVNQLTERLISEFTIITKGLLSNVAIMGLSLLRKNTHKILKKFTSDLDAPYLTHRAWTEPSEEAQKHPIAMLASEIQDVLEGYDVSKAVSPKQIKLWIDSLPERVKSGLTPNLANLDQATLLSTLEETIVHGAQYKQHSGPWRKFLDKYAKKDREGIITSLMLSDNTGGQKDREFAMLTTIRSHYNTPPPSLTLGTIIVLEAEIPYPPQYYICIQPVCDSVRLNSERKFPFLKLGPPKDGRFDLVIKHNEEFVELKVSYKPYDLGTFIFEPQEKLILAKRRGKDWVFTGRLHSRELVIDKFVKCYWIADLKFPHAQRIAENFGGEISRVGLMESDWLRRMAGTN